MSPEQDSLADLERLVADPPVAFEADCEKLGVEAGRAARITWLGGVRRGLISVKHGKGWWQMLIVGILDRRDPEWSKAVMRIGGPPRRAEMGPADRDAGRLQYTAAAVRMIKDALFKVVRDPDDPNRAAAGYAWLLWCSSVATGLRIQELRQARVNQKRQLVDAGGNILLRRMSERALVQCTRLAGMRDTASSVAGEGALFAAAERVWANAAGRVRESSRPALASARHLSLAVWRRKLNDAVLAVLLEEDEKDVKVWGQELHPRSELSRYKAPLPPRRRKVAGAAGFTIVELTISLVVIGVLLGVFLTFVGGRMDEARREARASQVVEALRAVENNCGLFSCGSPKALRIPAERRQQACARRQGERLLIAPNWPIARQESCRIPLSPLCQGPFLEAEIESHP